MTYRSSSKARGDRSEVRAADVLAAHPLVRAVRRSTRDDDMRGIDLWVDLHNGRTVPVQVKSSCSYRRAHYELRGIVQLLAGPKFTPAAIRAMFNHGLLRVYALAPKGEEGGA